MVYYQPFSRASSVTHQDHQDRQSPLPSIPSKAPEQQEEAFEEQKASADKEATPQNNMSSTSPDQALMPPLFSLDDNFKYFQDLMNWVVDSLQMPLEEVRESQHKLVDIFQTASSVHLALPIKRALRDPAKTILQTLTTESCTCKRVDKKCYFLAQSLCIFIFPSLS